MRDQRCDRRCVLLAVDVEPDGRTHLDGGWSGSAIAVRELSALRVRLQEAISDRICINWFFRFDPQIEQTWGRADWVRQACPDLLEEVARHGDYTGIHPHFWKWSESRKTWYSEFGDPTWLAECVARSIAGYRTVFGVAPEASRMGDRWLCDSLIPVLERAGIRYDLTIEPGIPDVPIPGAAASSWLPDYRRAPRVPYHPSPEDFLMASPNGSLWIVPLSTTDPPQWTPVRRFPFLMKVRRSPNWVLRPQSLWRFLEAEMQRSSAVPLTLVLRSGDLGNPAFLANFRYVAERLARHSDLARCRFTSVAEAMDIWIAHQTSPSAS